MTSIAAHRAAPVHTHRISERLDPLRNSPGRRPAALAHPNETAQAGSHPEACGKPAKSSHAHTHFIAAACCAKGLK